MIKILVEIERVGDCLSFNVSPSDKDAPHVKEGELETAFMVLDGINTVLDAISESVGTSYDYQSKNSALLLKIKEKVLRELNGN